MRSTRLLAAASLLVLVGSAPACLDRPVVPIQAGSCGLSAQRVQVNKVDKLDLLLMVDGSLSMSDKQSELSRRIPALIRALTNPNKDAAGNLVPRVRDLHVAVISSNLGSYGTAACDPALRKGHQDDRAHLLPRTGENGTNAWYVDADGAAPKSDACPSAVASAPISWGWDASAGARFTGTSGALDAQKAVSCAVQSVRDDGCGYEAQLEAIYRFLVDPAPAKTQEVACTHVNGGDQCGNNDIVATGVDDDLLAQRKAFLRPDSELAVVVLTDENDASLRPVGKYWVPWGTAAGYMPRGFKACTGVPDDVEPESSADIAKLASDYGCQTCMLGTDPAGNCNVTWPTAPADVDDDHPNLRAFHQVQRFGFNFLWGRQRYVDAFTAPKIPGPDGSLVVNPVFAGGIRTRDEIFVAAIVGVPKRLVEGTDGTPKPTLSDDEWAKIVSADVTARDPHMIESIAPRAGVPAYAGDPSVDPDNGGDRHIAVGGDLQFACIGKRSDTTATPTDCGAATASSSPLCATSGGTITQPYFKAYPGLRELRVLHDLSKAKVPTLAASICTDSYEGIMDQAFSKIDAALEQCLASQLTVDATGSVPCTLVELFANDAPDGTARCEDLSHEKGGYCTPGSAPCRTTPVDASTAASQLEFQVTVPQADGSTTTEPQQAAADASGNVYITTSDGKKHLVCELRQLTLDPAVSASDKQACQQDATFDIPTGSGGGWCYSTAPAVVGANCLARHALGKIRYFGDVQPHGGSQLFRVCQTGTCQ